MNKCGICGKELDHGAVVHRACLAESKASYDKLNDFESSQVAKLLERIAELERDNERLKEQLKEGR